MKISKYKMIPYFEKNMGQFSTDIIYKVKANDYITFFKENRVIVSLPSNIENARNIFSMKLENTNSDIEIQGKDKQIGRINYLIGNKQSKWITDIPTYSRIKYENIYENIDLYYYINNDNLEYDFILSKGANHKNIAISFQGLDYIEINEDENIVLSVGDVRALLLKPDVYQIIDNIKTYVDCEYKLDENNCINFYIGNYEEEYDLVLDPVLKLDYSTFVGGANCEFATSIVKDKNNNIYVTGYTEGGYPTTTGAMQVNYGGGSVDSFVTKLSSDGKSLIYSTYIGGDGADYSKGITVDGQGCVYITGGTSSTNFPSTFNSYSHSKAGNYDVFVSKLHEYGSLLIYSTYIGGQDYDTANAIGIDSKGCAYITGLTLGGYPTTSGVIKPSYSGYKTDAFVTKLNEDGTDLIYSTYLGGNGYDCGNGLLVDNEGYVYITGYAGESYPTTKGALQTICGGLQDVFVSKLNKDATNLIYSTYIGGNGDDCGNALAKDTKGYVYVLGYTESTNYPVEKAYQSQYGGNRDMFVSKLNIDGSSLIYSTYIGGSEIEDGFSIAVDNEGYAYIGGYKSGDAVVGKLSIDGDKLHYLINLVNSDNDYVRGILLDSEGYLYICGYTEESYPTTEDAYQTICGGKHDIFISKIMPIEFEFSLSYKPNKAKLLDIITIKLNLVNLNPINLDINLRYQLLYNCVEFVPQSLFIQNINRISESMPNEIYIPNIPPKKTAEVMLDLRYINEIFPELIPIKIDLELYENESGNPILVDCISETFYMETTVGPNYIPGCNTQLYNLSIDGNIQLDESGVPTIYYKSGTSYIYKEPNKDKYEYRVLQSSDVIKEYPIG